MNTRFTPFFVAVVMPFLLFSWFIPKGESQLDIWVLWLVAMSFLGLPMLFLEFALAKRSGQSVFGGMQILTREADAKVHWRVYSGLAVLLSILFASGFIAYLSERLTSVSPIPFLHTLSSHGVAFALIVIALIISPLKDKFLTIATAIIVVGSLLSLQGLTTPTMTEIGIKDWSVASMMALFSVGIGTGLYWFLDNKTPAPNPQTAIKKALPIWFVQLVMGSCAFVLANKWTGVGLVVIAFGVIAIAGFLLNFAMTQMMGKFGKFNGAIATIVLSLVFCAIPSAITAKIVGILGLLTVLILAIFAGWVMKISHLRKSLEFKTELQYNLWRVLVRWIIPIAVAVALVGIFL